MLYSIKFSGYKITKTAVNGSGRKVHIFLYLRIREKCGFLISYIPVEEAPSFYRRFKKKQQDENEQPNRLKYHKKTREK